MLEFDIELTNIIGLNQVFFMLKVISTKKGHKMTKKSISKQKNLKDLLQYFETFRSKMAKIKVFGASVVASLGLSEALLPFHFDIFNKTCVSHCTEEMTFK